jgi:acetyl-CoA acetyltransferase
VSAANPTRGTAAVIGLGATPQGRHPDASCFDLARDAAKLALADAGLTKDDIDGLITCKMGFTGEGGDVEVGRGLGINPAYSASLEYGTCNYSVHLAVAVINAGLANTVLLTYGTNQGSRFPGFSGIANEGTPYGNDDPITGTAALMTRRHQHDFGTTEEQFGAVAVTQRGWSEMNPLAIKRGPRTIDEYLEQPYVVRPLRPFDITPLDDGGVAVVITRAELAGDRPQRPVYILGMGQSTSLRQNETPNGLTRWWSRGAGETTFRNAGLRPDDIDVLMIQDPGPIWVLHMLEGFGFCEVGESGPFVAEGHTAPGGTLPVNTNGGHLSESYMWGWLHTCEAVRQLRGECGERQIPDAAFSMHCSTMIDIKASGTIYGLEP